MSHAPLKPIHQSLTFTTWSSLLCKSITSGKLSPRTWRKTWFCRAKETERERELFGQKEYTSWHKLAQADTSQACESVPVLSTTCKCAWRADQFYNVLHVLMFGYVWHPLTVLQWPSGEVCKATDASNQNTEICAELCSRSNGKAWVARPGSTVAIRYRAIHQDELILMPVPAETHQTWGPTVCSDQWMFGPTDQVDGSRKPLKVLKAIHPIAFKISKPLTSTT